MRGHTPPMSGARPTHYIYMADLSILRGLRARYFTLGCKLNFAETATFQRRLGELGVAEAAADERADLCIVNTCSVTDVADHKGRQAIRRLVRQNEGAFIVVTGCYAQLQPQAVAAIDGVGLVLGANEKADFINLIARSMVASGQCPASGADAATPAFTTRHQDIRSFAPCCSRGDRTRYFLKVQDGCDYFCTYCTIPFARGRSRNASIASLTDQAAKAASDGAKEIVITGVNIGDFGKSTGESFADLCRTLDKVEGIARYRISSIEPDLLSDELIDFCAASRAFMPHFHIPLQCGADEVLRLMHRHYDTALFARKIARIKQAMPDAFIGVDVMTGTRGETAELFRQSKAFIESLPVSQLHVFPYSERPGTAALRIEHRVEEGERQDRCRQLIELSEAKRIAFYEARICTEADVLLESAPAGKPMHGFTPNYIRAELPADKATPELDNKIVRARLGAMTPDGQALEIAAQLEVIS